MDTVAQWFAGLTHPATLFFALAIGHALADYPLQTEFIALGKNHRLPPERIPGGLGETRGVWVHCLTAHCLIHAGVVWLLTGSVLLGLVELVLHWIIDFLKSEGWTNLHVDQFLHYACKAGYVWALQAGWVAAAAVSG
jgi:hypothetical protein